MASDDLADELFELQTENRSLKDTIQALRDELEGMRAHEDEMVQKALAGANDELNQLKGTGQCAARRAGARAWG